MAAKKRSRRQATPTLPDAAERLQVETAPRGDVAQIAPEQGNGTPAQPVATVIVGVGASAGGLNAFREFLAAMPHDAGMAYVLVQHLDPNHRSRLAELLDRSSSIEVCEAADGTAVEPNRAYLIPPNQFLSIREGRLYLSPPPQRRGPRMPIDFFFRSLADDQQDRAVGVLLSGNGSDGALGLMQIKGRGGLTIVQDPRSAEYDAMARSAVALGMVDCVLTIPDMPATLIEFARDGRIDCDPNGAPPTRLEGDLDAVLAALHESTGYEFRQYKRTTLARRVQRRMSLSRSDSAGEYARLVRSSPDEARRLLKDLLIGVTQFFREPEAWQVLRETAIPAILSAKSDEMPVRVWVPGCATGEEAYSMAILLIESLEAAEKHCPIQVFATDIDADALELGRAGVYPRNVAQDLSPEQLSRFFVSEGETWRVTQELRDAVVFAVQNVISDPPFSRLDLISCRNLLIYIDPDAQQRVISVFHFALCRGGHLFLGPSETIGPQDALFEPVNLRWKIYRRLDVARRAHFDPPLLVPEPTAISALRQAARRPAIRPGGIAEIAQQVLLEHFAPASVLISRNFEALYFFGPTQNYLSQPAGERTDNLMEMVAEGLRSRLRAAIHQAISTGRLAAVTGARVRRGDTSAAVRVTAVPLGTPSQAGEELFLVTFQDVETAPVPSRDTPDASDEAVVRQLEGELRTTREELRSTIEEMDAWNEELRASNEEIMSMNEELQSTNEELEASKEELQSLNEELATVNRQLLDNLTELERANNDLNNLLTSTHIATLFLDPAFRIKRHTPDVARIFRGASPALGRPISDYADLLPVQGLLEQAREVLETLVPARREVRTDEGHWFTRRVLPYRTHDNRIEGVVVTFADVTELRQAYEAVQESEQRFRAMSDSAPVLIWLSGTDGLCTWFNKPWLEFTGRTMEQELGNGWVQGVHPDDHDRCLTVYTTSFEARKRFRMTYRLRRRDGEYRWILDEGVPRFLPDGTFAGYIGSCIDITDRKQIEQWVRDSEERYRSLVQATTSVVWVTDAQGAFVERQVPFEVYTGLSWEQYRGWGWAEAIHPEDRERLMDEWRTAVSRREIFQSEGRVWHVASREHRHFIVRAAPVLNEDGSVREWVGTITDIHEQRQAELARAQSEDRLRLIADSLPVLIAYVDAEERFQFVNKAYETWFGVDIDEIRGRTLREVLGERAYREAEPYFRAALQGRAVSWERELNYSRARPRFVHVDYVPDVASDGTVRGYHAMIADLTERHRAEKDRARLAALIESSSDAIIGKSLDGRVTDWNTAAERMYGYTAAEAVGQSLALFTPPERMHELMAVYERVAHGESLVQYETVRVCKDGRHIDVSLTLSPIRNADGEIIGVSGIDRDITERKRIEAELRTLTDTLEQRVRERTAQLRALAGELTTAEHRERRRIAQTLHDHIQQILVAAKMRVAVARGRFGDDTLNQALGEIDALIAESIDASRSLAVDLSPPVLHDAGLVAALEWLARHMEKQYQLRVEVASDTPLEASENITIFLFQAVRELLFNVVKHSGADRASIRVDQTGDGRLRLTIADPGRGFDPQRTTADVKAGGGLGLFGIRERLEHLGGELQIESRLGDGTRAVLLAPADVAPDAAEAASARDLSGSLEPEPALPEKAPAGPAVDRIRILLVDDHRILRDGLVKLLRDEPDFEVAGEAAEGRAAVELAGQLRPDLVLMDVTLPDISGVDATRMIKQELPQTIVVGLSMHEEDDLAAAMRSAGASAYLTKGGPSDELLRAIRGVIGSRDSQPAPKTPEAK